ncbi:hypothetical protein C3L33_21409, partial [Rhododendron williamsianum]
MSENRNGPNGKAGGASAYSINLSTFGKRLKMLYSHWKEHNDGLWGASEVLAIATPPPSEDLRYLKSSALNVWLVGYEFPDTIMVFMKKQIHFLCSQKKASLLEVVKKSAKEVMGAEVVVHVKTKSDDGTTLMETIFKAVRAQSKSDGHDTPVVGYIAREVPEGNLLETWAEKLKNSDFQLSDITNGFADLFAVKDSDEITNVKKAAYLTSSVMKHFVVPKLEKVIDEEKKISHSSLMDDTEKVILEPAKVKVKLKADNIDICYPPIFQSGGGFDLKPSASSNDENLYYDSTSVIICAIGKAYEVLLKAHDAAIGALKPGNKAGAAYQAAVSVVEKMLLNLVLKPGMVFNVSLGFQNLQAETKNPKTQNFSVLLSDTVIVTGTSPEVVTSISSKAVKDVAYSFNEDDEEEEEEKPKVRSAANGSKASLPSKATLRSVNHDISKEEQRRQHQAELARQKNEETARRLAGGGSGSMDNRGGVRTSGELIAYKSVNDLPPPRDLAIQIDQKREAILLPIYGSMVPFHVAMIKRSVVRSKDPRHISEVVQLIKTLRRQVTSRESEKAERATLVSQEKLQVSGAKFKPIRLSDLWIRPVFSGRGRKLSGTLEAHSNGFRYSTSRPDERVDVMFANIKHAFFQPAEREMITLLHFHLHNHIMVGNKKTKDGNSMLSEDLWGQTQFKSLDLEFDQPFRDLGFHGVPHKASAFIVPTSSCLVELIETPFVVITLNEIEIVNLERVGLGQKNFDMTIVFKDFKRDVFRIDSIPSTSLDGIKEWLDTTDLKYYEGRLNLNWRPILRTITDDPEKFIEDGGLTQVQRKRRRQRSLVESEDDDEEESEEGSEEDEGKTWEELEREASRADREKGDESDSENERKRRQIKTFGKARVPDKRIPSGSLPKRPKFSLFQSLSKVGATLACGSFYPWIQYSGMHMSGGDDAYSA